MTDLSTGGYTPDNSPGGESSRTEQVAEQGARAAGHAATDVKDKAVEQAQRVGAETKAQARNLAGDVRDRLTEQARTQNDRLAGSIRETADQLDEMRGDRSDSPAATVVARVADGGRQLADYLDRNGPDGVLREVQDFARRRPGAFLATALAAGFVVGRLGKGVAKAGSPADKPGTDEFSSSYRSTPVTEPPAATTYPATTTVGPTGTVGTEYAATGTGRPVPVDEGYPAAEPEIRR
ncbi:hypothetical protein [Actinoplanes subtropicus]|uniref:hypothetical protein n=1 Tax=Actinoplanes subtropicus TaxID=543632 RepID=UPI000689B609|nr:hypothetical protein [Actinoplanes subtropicus]